MLKLPQTRLSRAIDIALPLTPIRRGQCFLFKLDNTRRARWPRRDYKSARLRSYFYLHPSYFNHLQSDQSCYFYPPISHPQRQSTAIRIMRLFSHQEALVRSGPVFGPCFGPEGSALHAKRTKDWSKTGPRTDFVTHGYIHGWIHGYTDTRMDGQTNMFYQTPLHNSPFGAIN